MPLSAPAARKHLHTRTVECVGYHRDDGLWDIEAHLVDVKTYTFPNHDRGEIKPGEALHNMWIRLTIDDEFLIKDVEAVTDDSPFLQCGDIAVAYRKLIGLRIGRGFHSHVNELFSGAAGCTHLLELLRPLATTAYQTLYPAREKQRRQAASHKKPGIIDSCYALRSDGEVVAREWPDFFAAPDQPATEKSEA